MSDLEWHTETRRISELTPSEVNPRQLTNKQKDDLKESLERFNLVEIPAVDTDGTILAGHQRLKIMTLLGRGNEEIDVRVPNRDLTVDERREYLIRSNKNTGEWDWDVLSTFDNDELIQWGFTDEELFGDWDDGDDEQPEQDTKYSVVISCESAVDQNEIYNELSAQGYDCKKTLGQ